jgi:hypothetical protein
LLNEELDLSSFATRFCNRVTGARAYPPALLLKVVLFAYSHGIISIAWAVGLASSRSHACWPTRRR